MINLFIPYYQDRNPARQRELQDALRFNRECGIINRVVIVTDEVIDESVDRIILKHRPSYNVLFDIIRENSEHGDINIIANADIYFDETLSNVDKLKPRQVFALTRWEVDGKSAFHLNRVDSQDVWIFKGHPVNVNGDFLLGVPGCDNRIAYEFQKSGYTVLNPSKTIKTYHLHKSQVRNYHPDRDKVQGPYLTLQPISI